MSKNAFFTIGHRCDSVPLSQMPELLEVSLDFQSGDAVRTGAFFVSLEGLVFQNFWYTIVPAKGTYWEVFFGCGDFAPQENTYPYSLPEDPLRNCFHPNVSARVNEILAWEILTRQQLIPTFLDYIEKSFITEV